MADTGNKPTRKYRNAGNHVTHAGEHSNMKMFDFGIILQRDKEALGYCPICFGVMSWGGSNEDHIVTDKQYFDDNVQHMTNSEYNAESNLMTAHHRCNEFKKETDLFEYWRNNSGRLLLSRAQYAALIAILNHLEEGGRASLTHIAPQDWNSTIFKIVRSIQNRDPDFVNLSVE